MSRVLLVRVITALLVPCLAGGGFANPERKNTSKVHAPVSQTEEFLSIALAAQPSISHKILPGSKERRGLGLRSAVRTTTDSLSITSRSNEISRILQKLKNGGDLNWLGEESAGAAERLRAVPVIVNMADDGQDPGKSLVATGSRGLAKMPSHLVGTQEISVLEEKPRFTYDYLAPTDRAAETIYVLAYEAMREAEQKNDLHLMVYLNQLLSGGLETIKSRFVTFEQFALGGRHTAGFVLRGDFKQQIYLDVEMVKYAVVPLNKFHRVKLKETLVHEINHLIDLSLAGAAGFNVDQLEASAYVRTGAYFKGQLITKNEQWAMINNYGEHLLADNSIKPVLAVTGFGTKFLKFTRPSLYDFALPPNPNEFYVESAETLSGIKRTSIDRPEINSEISKLASVLQGKQSTAVIKRPSMEIVPYNFFSQENVQEPVPSSDRRDFVIEGSKGGSEGQPHFDDRELPAPDPESAVALWHPLDAFIGGRSEAKRDLELGGYSLVEINDSNDLTKAKDLAYRLIQEAGIDDELGDGLISQDESSSRTMVHVVLKIASSMVEHPDVQRGVLGLRVVQKGKRRGLEIVGWNRGEAIEDIAKATKFEFNTAAETGPGSRLLDIRNAVTHGGLGSLTICSGGTASFYTSESTRKKKHRAVFVPGVFIQAVRWSKVEKRSVARSEAPAITSSRLSKEGDISATPAALKPQFYLVGQHDHGEPGLKAQALSVIQSLRPNSVSQNLNNAIVNDFLAPLKPLLETLRLDAERLRIAIAIGAPRLTGLGLEYPQEIVDSQLEDLDENFEEIHEALRSASIVDPLTVAEDFFMLLYGPAFALIRSYQYWPSKGIRLIGLEDEKEHSRTLELLAQFYKSHGELASLCLEVPHAASAWKAWTDFLEATEEPLERLPAAEVLRFMNRDVKDRINAFPELAMRSKALEGFELFVQYIESIADRDITEIRTMLEAESVLAILIGNIHARAIESKLGNRVHKIGRLDEQEQVNVDMRAQRLAAINEAIAAIEQEVDVEGFSMSDASREAIVRTYLNNRNLPISPQSMVIRPLVDNKPDMQGGNAWVEAHPPELQELARFLLDNLTYNDQKEFEKALEETVEKLPVALGDRPYATLSYYPDKSENWVKGLVIEKGVRPPTAHIEVGERSFERDVANALAQGIKDVVIFDDAAYSGVSTAKNIDHLQRVAGEDVRIHVVIPYLTKNASEVIRKYHDGNPLTGMKKIKSEPARRNVFIYSSRTIPTIAELLKTVQDADKRSRLSGVFRQAYGRTFLRLTLTYFQHKVPDAYSFLPSLAIGAVAREWVNGRDPEVIAIVRFLDNLLSPPYRMPDPSDRFGWLRETVLKRSPLAEDNLRLGRLRGVNEGIISFLRRHALRFKWVGALEARYSDLFKPDNSAFAKVWESVPKFPAALDPAQNDVILVYRPTTNDYLNDSVAYVAGKAVVQSLELVELLLSEAKSAAERIVVELSIEKVPEPVLDHFSGISGRAALAHMLAKAIQIMLVEPKTMENYMPATQDFLQRVLSKSA